jgi:hypothetical protein
VAKKVTKARRKVGRRKNRTLELLLLWLVTLYALASIHLWNIQTSNW